MALTPLQRVVCQLLAANRIASGESYVAGRVALNECLAASRLSRDIDLFHDTDDALASSWRADLALLETHGFEVLVVRQLPALIEAEVGGAASASGSSGPETAPSASSRFSATTAAHGVVNTSSRTPYGPCGALSGGPP